jgi:hypothetical protein
MSVSRLAKMAKKSQESTAPEVSSLPIKQDESPLVIDLPDGQKLVVGHLANGSVIEVATWRGTGRPDSRTSRLMLGMSSQSAAAEQAKPEDATQSEAKKSPVTTVLEILNTLIAKAKTLKLPSLPKKGKSDNAEQESTPFIQTVSAPAPKSVDTDVDEWLNNLLAKSEEKAAKSSSATATKSKSTAVKKSAQKKTVRKAAPKSATRRSR